MPNPTAVRKAFNLPRKGSAWGVYKVTGITLGHTELEPHELYELPLTLELTPQAPKGGKKKRGSKKAAAASDDEDEEEAGAAGGAAGGGGMDAASSAVEALLGGTRIGYSPYGVRRGREEARHGRGGQAGGAPLARPPAHDCLPGPPSRPTSRFRTPTSACLRTWRWRPPPRGASEPPPCAWLARTATCPPSRR